MNRKATIASGLEMLSADIAFATSELTSSSASFIGAVDAVSIELRMAFAAHPQDEDGYLVQEWLEDAAALDYAATELSLITGQH